ncbi:hypothetical protein JKF63_02665 [Porcisia hertigi]|uniref:Protein N-terminal glutamine amidohydrolase n=1 Tax=Porcisia hertigi TaxID=2761500 RepID=A0A836IK49_9TRYP|nr:hypothetical protein JKF63_02665 [Porcisia hertigi]
MTRSLDYTFCYCEENVYKFLETVSTMGDLFDESYAVFMSSFNCPPCDEVPNRWTSVVPYRSYKYSEFKKDITTWDYHVIALVRAKRSGKWYVVDQDSRLPPSEDSDLGSLAPHCVDLDRYVKNTLFLDADVTSSISSEVTEILNRVRYRVVKRDDYLSFLRSDRSHMQLAPGVYQAKPPLWPLISEGSKFVEDSVKRRAESALSALPSTLRANNLVCFINVANNTVPGVIMDRHSFANFFFRDQKTNLLGRDEAPSKQ